MSQVPNFIYRDCRELKDFCKCSKCGISKDKYVKQHGFNILYKDQMFNIGCASALITLQEFIFINEEVRLEGLCIDCLDFEIAVYSSSFRCFHCRVFINKAAHSSLNGLSISSKHPSRRYCVKCARDHYIQIFEF